MTESTVGSIVREYTILHVPERSASDNADNER
jgi:hypothetical protein